MRTRTFIIMLFLLIHSILNPMQSIPVSDESFLQNTKREETMDEMIEEAADNSFSESYLNSLSDYADISINQIDNETIQYTFYEKAVGKENTSQLKIITYIVYRNAILNSGITEYNGSVELKAEMFFKRETVNGAYVYRLLYGTGKVVSNAEQYGKNLKIKVKASGSRTTLSGERTFGTEGWYTTSIQYPTIGTTYYNSHVFNDVYYFCDEGAGVLGLNVTYDFSHNGVTYYTISASVSYLP